MLYPNELIVAEHQKEMRRKARQRRLAHEAQSNPRFSNLLAAPANTAGAGA